MGTTTVRQLTLDTSKSKEGWEIVWITQTSSGQLEFEFLNLIFYIGFTKKACQWDSLISGMSLTRVCMTTILWVFKLSKSWLSLWIFNFFSSNLSNILQK